MACGHQSRDERTGNCPVCWDTQIQRQMAMSSQQNITARQMAYENMVVSQAAAQMRKVVEKCVPPSVEQLARALFETDERVRAFAMSKAESIIRCKLASITELAAITADKPRGNDYGTRYRRVLDIMWERDEGGWRSANTERASELRSALLQSEGK